MLNVSNDFKTAISAPYRVIRGRCTLAYDYPFIEGQWRFFSPGSSPFAATSTPTKLIDGIGLSDYYNDGDFRGFVSVAPAISDASGVFPTTPSIYIEKISGTQTVDYVQLVGDNATGEYPVDFVVYYRDQLNVVLDFTSVTANEKIKWDSTKSVAGVAYVTVTITKWSAPSTTAKITSFTIRNTETFTGEEIIKMDIAEEIEPEGGTIFGTAIAKKAEVTLSNFEDKFTNTQFLANRVFYPEYGATLADESVEYAPMGIYYTNDWKLSDDRYSLTIQGLDIIGYLTTQTYTNAMTTDSVNTLQAYLDNLLTIRPTYTTQTVYEAEADVIINFKLIAELKTKLNTFNLRDYLNHISLTGLIAKSTGTPNLYEKFGIVYIQSSRWENKIQLIGKFSEPKPIDQYTRFIANYFKAKNYRNDRNLVNTFRVETLEGVVLETFVPARVTAEGKYAETVPNTSFINSDNQMNISLYILPRLYAQQQSECQAEWQGNPAFELGDDIDVQIARKGFPVKTIEAQSNQGYIVANHFKYSGGLRCTTRTKVLRTHSVFG